MVPIPPDGSTETDATGKDGTALLCQAVRVALALYLLPVVAIVCAIGGASIAIEGAARLASTLAGGGRRSEAPARRAKIEAGWRASAPSGRRRLRAGR